MTGNGWAEGATCEGRSVEISEHAQSRHPARNTLRTATYACMILAPRSIPSDYAYFGRCELTREDPLPINKYDRPLIFEFNRPLVC